MVIGGHAMELEEFVAAKRELEQNLAAAIQAEINRFEATTGRTPIYVDVDMVAITGNAAGNAGTDLVPRRKFVVETVRTDIPLE
jgi:hypothetical protein